jgi:hypothetical protein
MTNKSTPITLTKFFNDFTLLNNTNYNNSILFTYDVGNTHHTHVFISPYFTNKKIDLDDPKLVDIKEQVPLFFPQPDIIHIPKKVEYAIRKFLGSYLTEIHPDKDVARELCLLLLAQLNSTNFKILSDPEFEGWKRLNSTLLRQLVGVDGTAYKRIIEILQAPLIKGQILEVKHDEKAGIQSRNYRLGDAFRAKGITTYQLETTVAKNAYKRYQMRLMDKSVTNPICKNLIQFYQWLEFPTRTQIEKEATKLIKDGFRNKKGKLLKRLNKHPKSYFTNPEGFTFVEDALFIYDYLTSNGLMVPHVGSEESGGRIIDSLVLMPSWIRRLIKYNGRFLDELDYKCLHPNIAMNLYGGKLEFLTHGYIEHETGIPLLDVKVEHLSFFNKTSQQMRESPLWNFYQKHEPEMLKRIVHEKLNSFEKYKITSRKLFKKEVDIMTCVIERLNAKGIYVGYVYDALICAPKDSNEVCQTMKEVVLEYGVKTMADVTKASNLSGFVETVKDSAIDLTKLVKWKGAIVKSLPKPLPHYPS